MSRGAALTGALLVTLASPATWPLALAAFLLRGGLLVVALPILVLPTPVGLGNLLAPTLTAFVFGGVSLQLAVTVVAIAVAAVAWIVAGGILAAILEAEATRIVSAHEETAPPAAFVRPSSRPTSCPGPVPHGLPARAGPKRSVCSSRGPWRTCRLAWCWSGEPCDWSRSPIAS